MPSENPSTSAPPPTTRRALVLGGGGVTGIGWQVGLLEGLAERGVDLGSAQDVIGTSAGSVSGALLTSFGAAGLSERLLATPSSALVSRVPFGSLVGFPAALLHARGDTGRLGRHLVAWSTRRARRGRTTDATARSAEIADRLVDCRFDARLTVVAVSQTGERRVFTAADGVELVDAVTASCAAPGIYPPVRIAGELHVDGGASSSTNADLARDADRIVVLAPFPGGAGPLAPVSRLLADTDHCVVAPDTIARKIMGRHPLDPAHRAAAVRAGREQAERVVADVATHWDGAVTRP